MKKLILLLLFIPLISFSQEKEFDFSKVERVPIYPGCEFNLKNEELRSCFQKLRILRFLLDNVWKDGCQSHLKKQMVLFENYTDAFPFLEKKMSLKQ